MRAVRARSRAVISLGDQCVYSASNFLAVVLVARGASVREFGVFALGYAFVTALVSITRAVVGTPLLLDADADERSLRTHLGHALVGGAATAVVGAAAVYGLIAAFGTPTSAPLAVLLAVSAPVIVVHDLLRHGAAALGKPIVALVADVTWCTGLAGGLAWSVLEPGAVTTTIAIVVWAGAAVAALASSIVMLRPRPRARGLRTRLLRSRRMRSHLVADTVIGQGAPLVVLVLAVLAIGASASAALRGAGTLLGPLNVLFAFLTLGLLPEAVRRGSSQAVRTMFSRAGAGLAGLTLLWGAVLLALPDSWGTQLLGGSWDTVRVVLPFVVVEYALLGVFLAGASVLRAFRRTDLQLRVRYLVGAIVLLGGGTAAILAGDVRVIATASLVAMLVGAVASWTMARRLDVGRTLPATADHPSVV